MKPTDILTREHRVIEQVLRCTEIIVERALAEGVLDRRSAREAVTFLRTFADGCHHGKEESQLFPAMEARGFSEEGGALSIMCREHELGRLYLQGMDGAVEAAAKGDAESLGWFADYARKYIHLLREHIRTEDQCVFPSGNRVMSDDDQKRLMAAFTFDKAGESGERTYQACLALADKLAERLGVPKASDRRKRPAGGAEK